MYLKTLRVWNNGELLREVSFESGLNFILDDTSENDLTKTGNGVGKTTTLKCIDYCLGGDGANIYTGNDAGKKTNEKVKMFLFSGNVYFELIIVDDCLCPHQTHVIRRNFGKGRTFSLDGQNYPLNQIDVVLKRTFFPLIADGKPTFRQIVSKNIRYNGLSLENVVKYLDPYTSDAEYESLFLFFMGFPQENAELAQKLRTQIKDVENYITRLEKERSCDESERYLAFVESQISKAEARRKSLNLDPDFEKNLEELSAVKERKSSLAASLAVKAAEIDVAERQLSALHDGDLQMEAQTLRNLYEEANSLIPNVQLRFDELLSFHSSMVEARRKWYETILCARHAEAEAIMTAMNAEAVKEQALSKTISMTDSYAVLEELISNINGLHEEKGKLVERISQIKEARAQLEDLKKDSSMAEGDLYSKQKEVLLKERVDKFNDQYFSKISQMLYGENYLLNVSLDEKANKGNNKMYRFSTFNPTYSTGTVQGEILAFDLAYIEFAEDYRMPHLSFLMYDKKELMSDNQLISLAKYLKGKKTQVILAMLRDKVPPGMIGDGHISVELSEEEKFFRLEP